MINEAITVVTPDMERTQKLTQLCSLTSLMIQRCIEIYGQVSVDPDALANYLSVQSYCGDYRSSTGSAIIHAQSSLDYPFEFIHPEKFEVDIDDLPIDRTLQRITNLTEPDDFKILIQIANDINDFQKTDVETLQSLGRIINVIGLPCVGKTTLLKRMESVSGINPIYLYELPRSHENIFQYLRNTINEEFTAGMILKNIPASIVDGGIWHRVISIPAYLGFDPDDPKDCKIIEEYIKIMALVIPPQVEILIVNMDPSLRAQSLEALAKERGIDEQRRAFALEREATLIKMYDLLKSFALQYGIKLYEFTVADNENQVKEIQELLNRIDLEATQPVGALKKALTAFTMNSQD